MAGSAIRDIRRRASDGGDNGFGYERSDAMNIFEQDAQRAEAKSAVDKLAQIHSSALVIKCKSEELKALRDRWVAAGIAAEDLAALDALTPKVAALYAAVQTYIA